MRTIISKILLLFLLVESIHLLSFKEFSIYKPNDIEITVLGYLQEEETISLKRGSKYQDLVKEIHAYTDTDLNVLDNNYPLYNNQTIIFEKIKNKININSASLNELCALPGIGEKTALKIIDYRNLISFKRIEDIKKVSGIGDKKYEVLKEYITI